MGFSIILQLPDKNFVKKLQKACGLTGGWRFDIFAAHFGKGVPLMSEVVVAIILIAAGICDVKKRKIPNYLILAGWCYSLLKGFYLTGWKGSLCSIVSVVIVIFVSFPVYRLQAVGAGDIKLLSVVGAVNGLAVVSEVTVVWLVFVGALSAIMLIQRGLLRERFRYMWSYFTTGMECGVPYYDRKRDGMKCTMILAPAMLPAYFLVLWGRWNGYC